MPQLAWNKTNAANMQEIDQKHSKASSNGLILAQFWHIMA